MEKAIDLPRAEVPAGLVCRWCKAAEFTSTIQTAKNGHQHVRLDCARCARFARYAKQRRARRPKHSPAPGGGVRSRGMTVLRMPFGKFRGRPVERVESEYLRWLLRAADLRPELRDAIRCELLDRQASELLARGE